MDEDNQDDKTPEQGGARGTGPTESGEPDEEETQQGQDVKGNDSDESQS